MSDIINSNKEFSYSLENEKQKELIYITAKALASKERLEILRLLEMSAPLHFKQNKRVKDRNNAYEKQTIEVYKRKR